MLKREARSRQLYFPARSADIFFANSIFTGQIALSCTVYHLLLSEGGPWKPKGYRLARLATMS